MVNSILCRRFTPLSRSQVPSSTNVHVDDMKRSSACISVAGMVVKKPMAP
jgi:hypothetical protein